MLHPDLLEVDADLMVVPGRCDLQHAPTAEPRMQDGVTRAEALVEVDDVDAIGKAGTAVVAERPGASVVGVGRHNLGSNIFWYLSDPAGTFFEFYSDMDQIVDDEAWERDHLRRDWEGSDGPAGFSVWGPKEPPPEFFNPLDLDVICAAREALGWD